MKKEWLDKWLAALRSGEYKQGTQILKSIENKFCCLGVLCDLVAKEYPEDFRWEGPSEGSWFNEFSTEDDSGEKVLVSMYPPRRLYDVVGLLPIDEAKIAKMNDFGRNTFTEIADELETKARLQSNAS